MRSFGRGIAPPEWLEDAWSEMRGRVFMFTYAHDNSRGGIGMWVDANAYCVTFANVTLIDGPRERQTSDTYIVPHDNIEALQPYDGRMAPTVAVEVAE